MQRRVFQIVALALSAASGSRVLAQEASKLAVTTFPTACGACVENGRRMVVRLFFDIEAPKRLLKAALPEADLGHGLARTEPWLFDLVVGRDGVPCSLSLERGEAAAFVDVLRASVLKWKFSPFLGPGGKAYCMRTQLFVYLREEHGKTAFLIPGLTDHRTGDKTR